MRVCKIFLLFVLFLKRTVRLRDLLVELQKALKLMRLLYKLLKQVSSFKNIFAEILTSYPN